MKIWSNFQFNYIGQLEVLCIKSPKKFSIMCGVETSLVPPVETKQVQKVDLNWTCISVHTRTERYDIISFQFLVHFSNYWTCFGTDRLIFFHTLVNATPLHTTFWNGPKWNGTISCPCEQVHSMHRYIVSQMIPSSMAHRNFILPVCRSK